MINFEPNQIFYVGIVQVWISYDEYKRPSYGQNVWLKLGY